MIVMDIQISNFFLFKNFHMNMSYPKRIVDSYIQEEFLKDRPNFRYKKVNILMGANATGKTSFGRMLMLIFNFMYKKQFKEITEVICDRELEASFSMDFVMNTFDLYRIDTKVTPKRGEGEYKNSDIHVCVKKVKINQKDSYENCKNRIDKLSHKPKNNYIEELEIIKGLLGTDFSKSYHNSTPTKNIERYQKILEYTLKTLDPSIVKVDRIDNVENSFVLRMRNQSVIMQNGEIIEPNKLSSGTKAGIAIANFMASIINGTREGFYYCDEKFLHIQRDIEKSFLAVMIDSLRSNEQLFFTTHNTDILDMPLPKHSFAFLRKDLNDEAQPIKCISASQYLKRNTDSLRNAVNNDLFSSSPSEDYVYKIADL